MLTRTADEACAALCLHCQESETASGWPPFSYVPSPSFTDSWASDNALMHVANVAASGPRCSFLLKAKAQGYKITLLCIAHSLAPRALNAACNMHEQEAPGI